MKADLYLLVDHEYQYKQFEIHSKQDFDEWVKSENYNTFSNVLKYYKEENLKTGKHGWYLDECEKDMKNALAKLKSAHISGKNDKEWKELLDSKPFAPEKLFEDGLGNWLVKITADSKVLKDIENMIEKDQNKWMSKIR